MEIKIRNKYSIESSEIFKGSFEIENLQKDLERIRKKSTEKNWTFTLDDLKNYIRDSFIELNWENCFNGGFNKYVIEDSVDIDIENMNELIDYFKYLID